MSIYQNNQQLFSQLRNQMPYQIPSVHQFRQNSLNTGLNSSQYHSQNQNQPFPLILTDSVIRNDNVLFNIFNISDTTQGLKNYLINIGYHSTHPNFSKIHRFLTTYCNDQAHLLIFPNTNSENGSFIGNFLGRNMGNIYQLYPNTNHSDNSSIHAVASSSQRGINNNDQNQPRFVILLLDNHVNQSINLWAKRIVDSFKTYLNSQVNINQLNINHQSVQQFPPIAFLRSLQLYPFNNSSVNHNQWTSNSTFNIESEHNREDSLFVHSFSRPFYRQDLLATRSTSSTPRLNSVNTVSSNYLQRNQNQETSRRLNINNENFVPPIFNRPEGTINQTQNQTQNQNQTQEVIKSLVQIIKDLIQNHGQLSSETSNNLFNNLLEKVLNDTQEDSVVEDLLRLNLNTLMEEVSTEEETQEETQEEEE